MQHRFPMGIPIHFFRHLGLTAVGCIV